MKKVKIQNLIANALIGAFFLMTSNMTLTAQKTNQQIKHFNITMERSNNKIVMKCSEGCSWKDLSYENDQDFQTINEFGMTNIDDDQADNNESFLIKITKTDSEIKLKGLKGTVWTDLSFSLTNSQIAIIDEKGVINRE
jgi:hypothetical protein